MRNSNLLRYFVCVFTLHSISAEEGLYRAKDTKVPGSIEIAGESVLQMVLLSPNSQIIPQSQYNSYLASQAGENFILSLTIQKVKSCKEQGLSQCEIRYKSYGSAFLADNDRTLWTAKHVLAPQGNGPYLFELYTFDGEKVFDTSDRKDQATLVLAGREELIQKRHAHKYILDQTLKEQSADYAKLQLNRGLPIRPLRTSSRKPQPNQRVYTVGYANMSLRGPTSQGAAKTRSRVGIGVVCSYTQSSTNESSDSKRAREAIEDFTSQHLITMDLDGLPGQSGSPVLNDSGEVVGVFIAGNAGIAGRSALRGLAPHFEGIFQNPQQ